MLVEARAQMGGGLLTKLAADVADPNLARPPLAGRRGLRLDFNESTIGCSPRVLERLRSLDAETLAALDKIWPGPGEAPKAYSW